MIKHVTLDLWLTLIKSHPEYKRRRAERAQELIGEFYGKSYGVKRIGDVLTWVDKHHNHMMHITGVHRLTQVDMWGLALSILGEEEFTHAQLTSFIEQSEHTFFDYPPRLIETDLLNTLRTLKDMNLGISIISNTGFITKRVLVVSSPVSEILEFVDKFITSDTTGLAKPGIGIFREAAISTFKYNNFLHVGDNLIADVAGARAAGFLAVQFGPGRTITKIQDIPQYIKDLNDAHSKRSSDIRFDIDTILEGGVQ